MINSLMFELEVQNKIFLTGIKIQKKLLTINYLMVSVNIIS